MYNSTLTNINPYLSQTSNRLRPPARGSKFPQTHYTAPPNNSEQLWFIIYPPPPPHDPRLYIFQNLLVGSYFAS